ncbi:MAG: ATP-binding protein [Marinilabiliales bacterium]|nr:ATP-binding protein [Marinilabiliales bacterium]
MKRAGAGRSHALIRFADTGKGMDAETSSRMFEPFFTSGKKGAGTGLGLTIVQDIVSEMEGTLKVSSENGQRHCHRSAVAGRNVWLSP